jgi:superoxide dismutase, Cu-Zn family
MMRRTFPIAAALAASLVFIGCAPERQSTPDPATPGEQAQQGTDALTAVAQLDSRSGSSMTGMAVFTQDGDQVTLVVEIEGGGEAGSRGIHIHEVGDCSADDASSAGPHWNPSDESHGALGHSGEAHHGDIGNIRIGDDGRGRLEFTTDRWTIGGDGDNNIVGRSLVIHAGEDDLTTQPSGNSGDRVACGAIQQR